MGHPSNSTVPAWHRKIPTQANPAWVGHPLDGRLGHPPGLVDAGVGKCQPMRLILTALLICGSVLARAQAVSEDQKKPVVLTLTVTSAQASTDKGGKTTDIMGYLSNDPRRRAIPLYCDTPIAVRAPDGQPEKYVAIYCRGEKPACILAHVQLSNSTNTIGQVACYFESRQ